MEKNEYHEGRTFHILSFPLEVINSDGSSYECVLECITIKDGIEQGKNQGVITKDESALVDSLTGLNNWDGFYKTVRKTLSQAITAKLTPIFAKLKPKKRNKLQK